MREQRQWSMKYTLIVLKYSSNSQIYYASQSFKLSASVDAILARKIGVHNKFSKDFRVPIDLEREEYINLCAPI